MSKTVELKPELDGFHDLMDDSEQALFDLAVAREHRQEQLSDTWRQSRRAPFSSRHGSLISSARTRFAPARSRLLT